jgi:asparagine synthase (glutamine-hydrolysing)
MAHRGPDGSGEWHDGEAGIGLAHRRLAIVDLSEQGRQPMVSHSGRHVVSYNGEIYNFLSLRRELEAAGHRFRGDSDTEVLLAAIEEWGVVGALGRFAGMFAFALWDRRDRKLWLARDRLGKKPLYLARCGDALLFASELKALHAYPGYAPRLSEAAVDSYLGYGYVAGNLSIFENTVKLPPGTSLEVTSASVSTLGPADILRKTSPYWDFRSVASHERDPALATPEAAAEAIEGTLRLAVRERMISDVPIGAFLSGGIDSSLVVALMQSLSSSSVKTFSIGFQEQAFDESKHARCVAEALGTDHTELVVTPTDALDSVGHLAGIYDEPFSDPSQIPTYLISKLARPHVAVALTGDGGDEVFGGYDIYLRGLAAQRLYRIPRPLRATLAGTMALVPETAWDQGLGILPDVARPNLSGREIRAAAEILGLADGAALKWRDEHRWPEPPTTWQSRTPRPGGGSCWDALENASDPERMMYVDTLGYLPNDILVKADRASMASSLELRSPLLDHRVIELAWTLPLSSKMAGKTGKLVLRSLLARHLPVAMFDRPKQGFAVPIAEWFRGPLRDWAENLLDAGRLERQGILDSQAVRAVWDQHLAGRPNQEFKLWTVLMLQEWIDHWSAPHAAPTP